MKMAAFFASVVLVVVMWFNITLGILGKAVFPDLAMVDQVYPKLVEDFLSPGLIGIVVAGVLAGGISTYDSIGSSIAAVFTRDIYARFFVKTREDAHYLTVSRYATFGVIALSFGYVPFLDSGMVALYLRLTSVAVMPLFTVYMMGTLTRVHQRSGAVGLLTGIAYGASSFLGDRWAWDLPIWWTNTWWAYLWSIVFTSSAMVASTLFWGWAKKEDLRNLVYASREQAEADEKHAKPRPAPTTWLERTREEVRPVSEYPFAVPPGGLRWYRRPATWAVVFGVIVGFVNLVVLW